MLELIIGGTDHFDDDLQKFVIVGGKKIQLEHSLVSLSKWESMFEKPFLDSNEKTTEEVLEYLKATVITPDFSSTDFLKLTPKDVESFNAYINRKQTATTFTNLGPPKKSREIVTSELIYYWLVAYKIPFECQHWFLNRLLTLIQVCQVKAQTGQKKSISRTEMAQRAQSRSELNALRKAQLNSNG